MDIRQSRGGPNDEDTQSEIPRDSCARIFLSLLDAGEGCKYSRLHDRRTGQHDYDQEPQCKSGQLHHHSAKWLYRGRRRRLHSRSESIWNHVPTVLRSNWARCAYPDRYRAESSFLLHDDRHLWRTVAGISALPAACVSSRRVCAAGVRLAPLHPGKRQNTEKFSISCLCNCIVRPTGLRQRYKHSHSGGELRLHRDRDRSGHWQDQRVGKLHGRRSIVRP